MSDQVKKVIKTPKYELSEYPDVYEPSADTFLFLDALEKEADFIKSLNPIRVVEIGSGSGVVISGLFSLLGSNCTYFATDINPQACLVTKNTASLNGFSIEIVNSNLLDVFVPYHFDLVVFNPPYVVTESEEMAGTGLNRAWAGGAKGREVIDKVLANLNEILDPNGVCYMIVIKDNDLKNVDELMQSLKYNTSIVMERNLGHSEHLYVLKFTRLKIELIINNPSVDLSAFPDVCDPSEDTYVIFDALEKEVDFIRGLNPKRIVEIGSGNGVVISGLFSLIGAKCAYFATDISAQACLATQNTARLNGVSMEVVNTNILDCFGPNQFDLVIFSPAYWLSDEADDEMAEPNPEWPADMLAVDTVLSNLKSYLAPNGVCYMFFCEKLGKKYCLENVRKRMQPHFNTVNLMDHYLGFEYLNLVKFTQNE